MEAQTVIGVSFIFILWMLACWYTGRGVFVSPFRERISLGMFFIIFTFFSLFDFAGGDILGYQTLYYDYIKYNDNAHMEDIYFYFADISFGSFYLWRFLVWGLAVLFLCLSIKRLKLSPTITCFLMLVIYFNLYVGARQSLGFSILLYASTFIIKPLDKKRFISVLFFLLFSALAIICHKSMAIYLVCFIIATKFRINKRNILILIALFPLLYASLFKISAYILTSELVFNEEASQSGARYIMSEDVDNVNTNGIIRRVIDWTPVILLYATIVYRMLKRPFFIDCCGSGDKMQILLSFAFILFYISWLFQGQTVSKFMAPRFWDASLFPLAIYFSKYLFANRQSKWLRLILSLFILSDLYRFMYCLYKI